MCDSVSSLAAWSHKFKATTFGHFDETFEILSLNEGSKPKNTF